MLLLVQAKQLIDSAVKPGAVQKAISLQLEAFWQRHGRKVIGVGAVFLLYFLWWALLFPIILQDLPRDLHTWELFTFANPEMLFFAACRKTLFSVTSVFVNLSETMAEFGFLVRSLLSCQLLMPYPA